MLIIPAIDILNGRCVRLIQGDYAQQRSYDADPVEMARSFVGDGAEIVHVVDLDGAKVGEPQNWDTLAAIAHVAPIEVGGGVRSLASARRLLDLGVRRVVVGSKLVQDEVLAAEFFRQFGDQVVAGIDARGGMAAVHGWTEESEVPATELAQRVERQGARRIILTDIARDGMLQGPNIELLHQVMQAVAIPVIASGGVGSLQHIEALASASTSPEGVIVGRALYEGKLTLRQALGQSAS
ncbi:MAG TPA: 1-(5-phosphoribosyl)-5-[(5-phosphoribosylamino)methylideneamino]imidazole-4-carboxamide isomerase [Fimbriimonas sp.]|nr:1-(5-phosphoribosyl)-5-[(5-phosphoribosylamino)methylideneamino]imidazole-4-carboxamide isomerase [Fimbriimonas sp.]